MTTWHTGRQLVAQRLAETEVPLSTLLRRAWSAKPPVRVPGTGIFMTARPEGAPPILVHHLTHNKVLHEQVVLLTVSIADVPIGRSGRSDRGRIAEERLLPRGRALRVHGDAGRARRRSSGRGQAGLRLGPDGHHLLPRAPDAVRATRGSAWSGWRDKLFVFLSRNARRATNFFQIPPDRVVEIGIQLEI